MRNFPHPFLAKRRFIAFAHRGGGAEQLENSMTAFAAARDLGFTHIETDVQATADGVPVVFHDDELDRATTGSGRISSLPLSAVAQAKIGGKEAIVTLEEALETFPDLCFNIDIKSDQALQPTIALLRRMGCLDRICLASFSDSRLRAAKAALGEGACISAGPMSIRLHKFASWGLPVKRPLVDCVQVPIRSRRVTIVTRAFVRHCHRRDIAVHVWTIDEEAEMRRLIRLGVDGLVTDRPSLLKEVAVDEGVWTDQPAS
jgi:glycerophosphoryl diester phosphodiesterase